MDILDSSQDLIPIPSDNIYEPLNLSNNEIRIINLSPGNFEDEIYCTAQTISLDTLSENLEKIYEALSYTWGTSEKRKTIYLNGKPLKVTLNLYVALQYLRYPSKSRCLWVDAVCINQSNIRERNHQVQRMRDIYASASQVLVWLGESNADIDNAFDSIVNYQGKNEDYRIAEHNEAGVLSILRGMEQISTNPWWTRVWVVQEVLVSKVDPIFRCGHKWLNWGAFKRFHISLLDEEFRLVRREVPRLNGIHIFEILQFDGFRNSYHDETRKINLDSLLIWTANREANDPKDNVFALFGLVRSSSTKLVINYDLDVAKVYQQAMMESFRTCGDIDLMLQAADPKKIKDLPSWCVDFSKRGWNTREMDYSFYSFVGYKPGLKLECKPSHDIKSGKIIITGKIIGNIAINMSLEGKQSRDNI